MRYARGQGMVEYGLIIGLVALVVVAVFLLLGDNLRAMFSNAAGEQQADNGRAALSALLYGAPGTGTITLSCNSSWTMMNNYTVSATVTGADGAPAAGVPVTLQLSLVGHCYLGGESQGGPSGSATAATGADGTVAWGGCQERGATGSGTVTVSAVIDGQTVSASQAVTVSW